MNASAAPPFAVLGIAPTADPVAVKRAYFAALARHPPHTDPEGFQRLRAAYEGLSTPDGLRVALALAPPDLDSELARYRARFDALLEAAARDSTHATSTAEAGTRLRQTLLRMSLAEALAAFAQPAE